MICVSETQNNWHRLQYPVNILRMVGSKYKWYCSVLNYDHDKKNLKFLRYISFFSV